MIRRIATLLTGPWTSGRIAGTFRGLRINRHGCVRGGVGGLLGVLLVVEAGASVLALPGGADDVRMPASRGEGVEHHLSTEQNFTQWVLDPAIFDQDQGDLVATEEIVEPAIRTVKLDDLVPPIHFALGKAEIPDDYLARLREVLESMRDRSNVRLHFVGHTDNLQLHGEVKERFGDNIGLSRERAGTTAEYFQNALGLPPAAISYEGLGESQPVASNATEQGRALNRRVEVQVWYDEVGEQLAAREVIVPRQVKRVKVCRTETLCKLRYKAGHAHRARVKNLMPPLHYEPGMMNVPDDFLARVARSMRSLEQKKNVMVKFTAYTDDRALDGRDKRIYRDHVGLSKAIALRVALAAQDALGLPDGAVASEGLGASRPIASNETAKGRSLNRRVEVEFWYDDPLQELTDEPRMCPDAAGAETVSRVYDPPSGNLEPILYRNGGPVIPDGYTAGLQRIMDQISDRDNVRLRFVGYASNEPLDRRTAAIYGDDLGWSTARAHRTLLAVSEAMGLDKTRAEFVGRGFVQSDDVVNAGFIESDTARVEVQVVYDELVPLDDYAGVEVTRLTREVAPTNPLGLNLMRITVDGAPVDDPAKSIPDLQRCTDLALDRANIQFKHDGLAGEPRLNVTAWPRTVRYQDVPATDAIEDMVHFRLYTNYHSFIDHAEVRIFTQPQSVRSKPLAVVPVDEEGLARWQVAMANFKAPVVPLQYLVRVYDNQGHFDETLPQTLWVADEPDALPAEGEVATELLGGYGRSRLTSRNIPIEGGSVLVQGSAIPAGHEVWVAGIKVPVDVAGRFAVEEILPQGAHTVEVAVLDQQGNGELFLRDLEFKSNDWFYVGMADLTWSGNHTDDDGELLAPDRERYSESINVDGRLAFYTKGRFGEGWELKASADTREGPLDEIFSNFLDKSPEALFRRIEPEDHYPTFGDDSTVVEDAPTSGKFYLRLARQENFGLWGNFKIAYTDTDLAQVDRGLYGANLHYQTRAATGFGEQRLVADGFAADPGTVGGRDEFRGTGGSLYFLRHQDILEGSERLRVEVRDKDTGIVLGVKNLAPALDYTVDYLQGRIMLAQPLETTVDDELLIRTEALSGNPVFLVARYEFTPGVAELDTLATGGRVHYWFNEHVKVGVTASQAEEEGREQNLYGTDVTLRKSTETWLKLEAGHSEGAGMFPSRSNDGGYAFDAAPFLHGPSVDAQAYRAETSLGLNEFFADGRGRFTLYYQEIGGGYLGPGLAAERDLTQYGGTASLPLLDWMDLLVKADQSTQREGLETTAGEIDAKFRLWSQWLLSTGLRHDSREDNSLDVPATQQEGDRTDAVIQLGYDSQARWSAYGFLQETLRATGNRGDNFRIGTGGSYRLAEWFQVTGEVSEGDAGAGARLGTEYLYSDRTTLYLNYALENERSDNGVGARKGNLTSGFRTRYSDSASVYLEEQYTHGDVPTGLMHSTGVDLALTDRTNLGGNLDYGTLQDRQTGAELERTAAAVRAGYGFEALTLAGAFEYRLDKTEQTDASETQRTTWLFKFDLKYQLSDAWRMLGKLRLARSDSSQGAFYDGEFTEAVVGYAYRPVHNDRLNALIKYTYFYNLPAAEQLARPDAGAGVSQRSHIASVDVVYDLTRRWSVGGKYAYRLGEVSLDRENPDYFDSRAQLFVLRLDWHVLHRWDALVEGRMLDLPDAEDRLNGMLVGVYRHLGDHVKLGAGYNFSRFSDDLTNFDYDHQGFFINLIGKI